MIDSAPRWSLILLDAAGKQEIVSCRVPVIPLGVLVGERNCQLPLYSRMELPPILFT